MDLSRLACLGAALLALSAGSAVAQDAADTASADEAPPLDPVQRRARAHFDSGVAYYDAGDYEDALREWQSAYNLSQRPELLYNLYLATQSTGDLDGALEYLERFLAEVEDIPNRATLELRRDNLRERIANRRADGGSDAATDRQEAHGTDDGAARDAPAASSGGDDVNVGAIVGFSFAAVGVVLAGVFGALTIVEDGDLANRPCSPERGGAGCGNDALADLSTYALVTDIGFGVALAGALVGTLLLLIDGGDDDEQARLAPWLTPTAGGAVVRGSL